MSIHTTSKFLRDAHWCHVPHECLAVVHFFFFRFVKSDYTAQTDKQISCTCVCTCAVSPARETSQRLIKNYRKGWGGGSYFVFWRSVGGVYGVQIDCTDVDFWSQIHISFNNLHIKYPPLTPPKPISGRRRRGAQVHVGNSACVD